MYSWVAKPPSLLYIDYQGEDLPPVATILPTHHTVPYSTPRAASHIPPLPYYTLHCAINRSAPCPARCTSILTSCSTNWASALYCRAMTIPSGILQSGRLQTKNLAALHPLLTATIGLSLSRHHRDGRTTKRSRSTTRPRCTICLSGHGRGLRPLRQVPSS